MSNRQGPARSPYGCDGVRRYMLGDVTVVHMSNRWRNVVQTDKGSIGIEIVGWNKKRGHHIRILSAELIRIWQGSGTALELSSLRMIGRLAMLHRETPETLCSKSTMVSTRQYPYVLYQMMQNYQATRRRFP